jgi:hypothetical protein
MVYIILICSNNSSICSIIAPLAGGGRQPQAWFYLGLAIRTLTTGAGGGSFALSAFWAFAMALRFRTKAADVLGNLGIKRRSLGCSLSIGLDCALTKARGLRAEMLRIYGARLSGTLPSASVKEPNLRRRGCFPPRGERHAPQRRADAGVALDKLAGRRYQSC